MVLKSIIVDVLNSIFGEYVTVDTIKLGDIFGGDITLDDLVLKQSALDNLDLPVKIVFGRLGKLVLTIPWTNPYEAPWVVQIERVFLLSVPNEEVRHDAEKEERLVQEAKQKEIAKVEKAKQIDEKHMGTEKSKFTVLKEKIVAHIVKLAQVKIKDVHLRYEDRVAHPGSPFSLGVTLSSLKLMSIDEKDKPTDAKQTLSIFNKVLEMEELALYWNPKSPPYASSEAVAILQKFQSKTPDGYNYMFGPISATAQLQLNQKPEHDGSGFTIPKIQLDMNMNVLSIGVSKLQFRDLVKFLESINRKVRAVPYRKYKALIDKRRGCNKTRWNFAYDCIIETEVRRKSKNWDWNHIKKHRDQCNRYKKLYKEKLEAKKPSAELLKEVADLEKTMDVFNIIVFRHCAEVQVEKTKKIEEESKKKVGWIKSFTNWWGGGASDPNSSVADIANKIEAAMTKEEKHKLYQAIGYQKNSAKAQYPNFFVAIKTSFTLGSLQVVVYDENLADREVVKFSISGVNCTMEQRPAAEAIKVEIKMQQLKMTGASQNGKEPLLAYPLNTDTLGKSSLLSVLFETNPLDNLCDKRLKVLAQPLEVMYDAETIIRLSDVFKHPEKLSLKQLQAMAVSKLEHIQDRSAILMQHVIREQKVLDVDIKFEASRMILPQLGKFNLSAPAPVLVVSLGSLSVASCAREKGRPNLSNMMQAGSTEKEVLQEMISQSYDKFSVSLKDVQVLVANPNENWKVQLNNAADSKLHLVRPMSINVSLHRSLLLDDPRVPQFKVTGQLPSLFFSLSDERLLLTAGILLSVPYPASEPEPPPPLTKGTSFGKSIVTLMHKGLVDRSKNAANEGLELIVSSVQLKLCFKLEELRVVITRNENNGGQSKLIDFSLMAVEMEMVKRPFDVNVVLRLGGVSMEQTVNGVARKAITTPMSDGKADYLFTTRLMIVNRKSPEFSVVHKNVEKLLEVTFTSLDLALYQSGILQVMEFAQNLQDKVSTLKPAPRQPKDRYASTRDPTDRIFTLLTEEDNMLLKPPVVHERKSSMKIITLKLVARMHNLSISLANPERDLTKFTLQGVTFDVMMMKEHVKIESALKMLQITDCNPTTIFPKILESQGPAQALTAKVIISEKPAEGMPKISVQAQMACFRIFFLNKYVSSLLGFLNNFQTALNAIKAASAAAAEAAKQNMQQAYENATRVALDIEIKVPLVIVPRSSKSRDAFVIDLGTIIMHNQLSEIPGVNETLSMDTITLLFKKLSVTRVMLDTANKPACQSNLLAPFDVNVRLKRNLSIGWSKTKTAIHLESQMEAIKLGVRQEDIKLAMLVLSENLADVEKLAGPVVAQAAVEKWQTEDDVNQKRAQTNTLKTISSVSQTKNKNGDKKLVFSFLIKSIEVNLLVPAKTLAIADEYSGLAHFNMSGMKVQCVIENGAINLVMKLEDCTLKDLRRLKVESSTRITNLLSLKGSREKSPMLYLNFNRQTANNQSLTCKVSGFTLVLNPDYLLKIYDFFISALPKQENIERSQEKATYSKASLIPNSVIKAASREAIFELKVVLEKPDIILVESMTDINTKALIFSVEGDGRVRMTPEKQVIGFSIKNIQLYSCVFNPERRKDTLIQVLRPCTLSVAGSAQTGQQPNLDVILSDVKIAVTPGIIKILANTMSALSTGMVEKEEEETSELPDWSMLWRPKSFRDTDHWFLLTKRGTDALSMHNQPLVEAQSPGGGLIKFKADSVIVTLEAGFGVKTLPLIILESSLYSQMSNWTQDLQIRGAMSLQMSYYNSRLALWEPLIEPTLDNNFYSPWCLNFEVKKNAAISPMLSAFSDAVPPAPTTRISVCSKQNLEITVSKSCLEVLTNLSKAFRLAVKEGPKVKELEGSPYQIVNQTGIKVVLLLKDSNFTIDDAYGRSFHVEQFVLESGAQCGLVLRDAGTLAIDAHKSILNDQVQEKILNIRVPDKNCTIKLPMARAEKRYFNLTTQPDKQGLVSEVNIKGSCRIVTLRTIIQVHNQFSVPVDVYYMTDRGNEVECVGVVQPGQKLDLPLHAVYTLTNELLFSIQSHTICNTPFAWKNLQNNVSYMQMLKFDAKNNEANEPYYLKAVGDMEHVYFEGTTMRHSCIFNIVLGPTVVLKNLLPVTLVYMSEKGGGELEVKPGGSIQIPAIEPGKSRMSLRLLGYLEKNWFCFREILSVPPELAVCSFDSYDSPPTRLLDMGMHTVNVNGTLYMSLFSPFWMINKTGLQLSYTQLLENSQYNSTNSVSPVLFSFQPKTGRKEAIIKANNSDWSNKFPLDVAGSPGSVSCKSNNIMYMIGVSISLSSSNLTKLVTFTPYYVITNHTTLTIQYQEGNQTADSWRDIKPTDCSPLWPRGQGHHNSTLRLKVQGTNEMTAPFSFTKNHTVLLKLHNKFGGINVNVQVSEGNILINLSAYTTGFAPALIVNHTGYVVDFWEKFNQPAIKKLAPMEQAFFSWEDPCGQKKLAWYGINASNNKEEVVNQLQKDGIGKLWVVKGSVYDPDIYWVSFLDGMQRVLLFTANPDVAREAQTAADLEPISMELTLSLEDIGLSLVSEIEKRVVELLYLRIASSAAATLESRKMLNKRNSERLIDVDPIRALENTRNPGLWFQLKISAHQRMLHAKLNHLQVDCQMPNCMFPNILAPVPPPKSVAADNVMKPFIELSMVQRLLEHSPVQHIKCLKVLVQEFHIKVERHFLCELLDMYTSLENLDADNSQMFAGDIRVVTQPLLALVAWQTAQKEQIIFFDELHLSPLKIHYSYSRSNDVRKLNCSSQQLNILHVVLENIEVTLTDFQDVIFKLDYFERDSTFLTPRHLLAEVRFHYTQQVLKQLYVLFLGLDMIGNPLGLVLGLSRGVGDFFYEPFQGAIQGPEELVRGLRNGISSLLGHTVSGTAGSMSKITGTLGKTMAKLSMDEEHQRRRREQQQSLPTTLHGGLAHSGKSLVSNVVSGVTGVITKPVAGARAGGVGGLFKGLSKGVLGLVTKPTGGVIDFASNTFQSVKRATDTTEEQRPLRNPRFFRLDGLIRPYNLSEAYGLQLVQSLEKGIYAKSDHYVFHALLGNSGNEALIYTDKQIISARKTDMFGHWRVNWNHPWSKLPMPPYEDAGGIIIHTGGSQSNDGRLTVFVHDANLQRELVQFANKIMNDLR